MFYNAKFILKKLDFLQIAQILKKFETFTKQIFNLNKSNYVFDFNLKFVVGKQKKLLSEFEN